MAQFIGYYVNEGRTDGTPVSTGTTREEALERATTRVLGWGTTNGSIDIQERPELPAVDFAKLAKIIDGILS